MIVPVQHSEWVAQRVAFKEVKKLFQSSNLLVHFDPQLVLACDTSPYGLGAVLSHVMGDSTGKTTFASHTYLRRKGNTPSLFGVERLHQYLYGQHLIIHSDHKPLMFICDESKVISQQHQLGSRDGPSRSAAIHITFGIEQVGSMQMQMTSAGYTCTKHQQ